MELFPQDELGSPYDDEIWDELAPDIVLPSLDELLEIDFPVATEADPDAEIIVMTMPESEEPVTDVTNTGGGGFFGGRDRPIYAPLDEIPQA